MRKPEVVSLAKTQLVNFIYDEAVLTEISKAKVEIIIEQIKQAEDITIEIFTHMDNIGSSKCNLDLSTRRAGTLKNLLTSNGIDSADITVVEMGEKKPIVDNSTKAGLAINRRDEFVFKAKSPTG